MAKASSQKTLYKDPYVAWCHDNDKTLINGAKIYTGSITADKINVADLFAQEITATGKITASNLQIEGDSTFAGKLTADAGGVLGFLTVNQNGLWADVTGEGTADYAILKHYFKMSAYELDDDGNPTGTPLAYMYMDTLEDGRAIILADGYISLRSDNLIYITTKTNPSAKNGIRISFVEGQPRFMVSGGDAWFLENVKVTGDLTVDGKNIIQEIEAIGQQNILWAEGDTLEEELAWLDAYGDISLRYALSDGYYYKCVSVTYEDEPVPNFTNVLDTATLSLNQRYNSSDVLKDANGIVALDYVPVKANDVIRFSKASVLNGSDTGYQRVKYYNSSKSAIYKNDVQTHKALKITTDSDGVASYVVGYINSTSGDDSTNALISDSANIAYTRLNLYLGSSAITEADIADLIMTINEPIEYSSVSSGTKLEWVKTDVPVTAGEYDEDIANHEKRILSLEDTVQQHEEKIGELANGTESESGLLDSMTVFAPSPQLPADGSSTADFNADTITCQNIYDYIDALVSKYPKYLTKETLGKDQSGEFDWNRYTCCRRYYEAWQKPNYPAMYGWVNGSTVIYSESVSPRISDTLYTTAYIGTAKGTVTAVDNANQSRTVGGVVYTRDKTKDVEPTLIYSVMMTCKAGNSVYDSAKSKVTTISSITSSELVGADGITYTRYPLGDRTADFVKPKVIVIGSNEHGRPLDPAEPAIISARMIKDLCECVNANNPFLNLLKNEYMVVFLPIINPWGYDQTHKSYYNSNGVNLDRNLDTPGWGNDTSNPQGEYGGSEAEMQYFMNTLVESGTKIVMANHALGTQTNSTGEGANSGKCHYMLGRNNSKYDSDLLAIAESMLANYNLFFTDYGEAPPESYAKTRSYIDWIGAEGGAVEMQAREGYVLDGTSQLHTSRILEADYTLHLQFLYMLIKNAS